MTPTPLRPLSLSAVEGIEIYLKDESAHPTGSMKYRLVRAMSCEAIASGAIKADRPVIAATSGAVAIAGAHFASLLGLDFTAVVPAKTPGENLARIEREGGRWQVGERPPAAVQEEARGLAERPGGHFLDHFTDAERAMAVCGEPTIADEIFVQLSGEPHPIPEWIVAGAGTGATSAAVGRHLRRHGHPTRLAVVDPENSACFPAWASGCGDYTTNRTRFPPGGDRPDDSGPGRGVHCGLVVAPHCCRGRSRTGDRHQLLGNVPPGGTDERSRGTGQHRHRHRRHRRSVPEHPPRPFMGTCAGTRPRTVRGRHRAFRPHRVLDSRAASCVTLRRGCPCRTARSV